MAVCIQAYTAHQKYNREQRHYEFFSIVKPVLNTCCILIFFSSSTCCLPDAHLLTILSSLNDHDTPPPL